MKHSIKQSIESERNRVQHIQQLYPDTRGQRITHTSSRTNSRNCGMYTDAMSCVNATCEWDGFQCIEIQYWSGTVYSVFNTVTAESSTGNVYGGPGQCSASFSEQIEFGTNHVSLDYQCEGFCCDGSLPDAIPPDGDGTIDMLSKQEYEQMGWLCFDEGNNYTDWCCCDSVNGRDCYGDRGFVCYTSIGTDDATWGSPGCNSLDKRECERWERQGICYLINSPCLDNQCNNDEEILCLDTVDNMARTNRFSSDEEAYGAPFIAEQISECCGIDCPTEYGFQAMICESEGEIGPGCICPGACPAGGMGVGTLSCFGCEGTNTEDGQDDMCDYPYTDPYGPNGRPYCVTRPGQGYPGVCE